jgi:hypothetical protein
MTDDDKPTPEELEKASQWVVGSYPLPVLLHRHAAEAVRKRDEEWAEAIAPGNAHTDYGQFARDPKRAAELLREERELAREARERAERAAKELMGMHSRVLKERDLLKVDNAALYKRWDDRANLIDQARQERDQLKVEVAEAHMARERAEKTAEQRGRIMDSFYDEKERYLEERDLFKAEVERLKAKVAEQHSRVEAYEQADRIFAENFDVSGNPCEADNVALRAEVERLKAECKSCVECEEENDNLRKRVEELKVKLAQARRATRNAEMEEGYTVGAIGGAFTDRIEQARREGAESMRTRIAKDLRDAGLEGSEEIVLGCPIDPPKAEAG